MGHLRGGDRLEAGGDEGYAEVGGAVGQRRGGHQLREGVTGGKGDGVIGNDKIPLGIDGPNGHPEAGAHGLGASAPGLAARAARRCRLTRHKDLQLCERPGLTVIDGLVLEVFVPSVILVAVTVAVPAVFSVTLKVCVPKLRAALNGRVALLSLEVVATVSLVVIVFQFVPTALTITLKATPAVCAVGVPVFPEVVPGAAVSPGISTCSLVKSVSYTAMEELPVALLKAVEPPVLPAVTNWICTLSTYKRS